MIFSISPDLIKASKIEGSTFTSLNIWERHHIQEWVRSNPEILGEDLLVVSIEFDRFSNSNDRLDVLALDRAGNLVVVELKRDSAAGYADLQAVRYAAMVSSMTVALLIPFYMAYQRKYYDRLLTDEDAKNELTEFVENESFTELSNKPRIILCSEGFSQEITATVLWLREFEVDISCVKITPYQIDDKVVIVPTTIIPLQEANQYLIEIRHKEEAKERSKKQHRPKTMKVLIENKLVQEGDTIFLKNTLPSYVQYEDGNPRFMATITGKTGQSNSVKWSEDGNEYSISKLAWKIFKEHHPERKNPGGVNGNLHWVNSEDRPLWEIAEEYLETITREHITSEST